MSTLTDGKVRSLKIIRKSTESRMAESERGFVGG